MSRKGQVTRKSKETQLSAKVELDGRGRIHVSTGLPFVDHMLEQVARYGGFDLTFRGAGDLHVDPHHLVEDAGIVVGQALSQALVEVLDLETASPAVSRELMRSSRHGCRRSSPLRPTPRAG